MNYGNTLQLFDCKEENMGGSTFFPPMFAFCKY